MRTAVGVGMAFVVAACGRPEQGSGPAASTVAPAASPVSTVVAADAAPAHVACDVSRGFHGTVAGQEAFMRLARKDSVLTGRYFYAKMGRDLALHGTVSPTNEVSLVEGDPEKPTGRFKGTCDAHGVLSGEWSDEKGAREFRFEPVASRDAPLIATKKLAITRKVKTVGHFGMTACEYEQTTFELFGAETPRAEEALNEIDATTLTPRILSKDTYADVSACETGVTASFGRSAALVGVGLVNVMSVGTYNYDGAAHPGNAVDFTHATYSLATGRRITEKDVYAKFPATLVQRCVDWYARADGGYELGPDADGHAFVITPEGLQIFGSSYGHAAAVLTGRGPVLKWSALRRDGALRADSPVKRAWESPRAAKLASSSDAGIPPSADCAMDGEPIGG